EAALYGFDRLVGAAQSKQLEPEFAKGFGVGGPPPGRTRHACQCIIRAPDLPQGNREPRLDGGILAGPRPLLERCDRLLRTALQQQRAAENVQGLWMLWNACQYLARQPLGILAAATVDSRSRPLQRDVDLALSLSGPASTCVVHNRLAPLNRID